MLVGAAPLPGGVAVGAGEAGGGVTGGGLTGRGPLAPGQVPRVTQVSTSRRSPTGIGTLELRVELLPPSALMTLAHWLGWPASVHEAESWVRMYIPSSRQEPLVSSM